MPRRVLIIVGHPDKSPERFCRALADAYAESAKAADHNVQRIDIVRLDIPLLRTKEEFESGIVPAALKDAQAAITAAEHLVFVFSLWLGTMPALLKAFLERMMRPGTAFAYPESKSGSVKMLLKGRSARIVVTMGMPAIVYRLWFFNHGISAMRRDILNFVGIKPVRETLFGMVEAVGNAKRAKWINQIRELGKRAA